MPPCIKIPIQPLPGPTKFNLAPPLPKIDLKIPNVCCLLPGGIDIDIAVDLPPLTVTVDFLAPVRVAFALIEALIAELPLDCPRQ